MLKVYCICYDLRTPGKDYSGLYDSLRSIGESCQHPLESVWYVKTAKSSSDLFNELRPKIDDNDSIIVQEMNLSSYSGWMPTVFWNWLKEDK